MSRDNIRLMSPVACESEGETTRMRHDVFEVAKSTASVSASVCGTDMLVVSQTRTWWLKVKVYWGWYSCQSHWDIYILPYFL